MKRVLTFDTSTAWCNVCVSYRQKVIVCESHYLPQAHSRELIPLIQKVLHDAQLTFKEIDRIATIMGPGSFTGLRVGLATAQGISFALNVPIVGMSAFRAYAHTLRSEKKVEDNILTIIDTQKTDIYCQLFDKMGNPLKEPEVLSPSRIAEYVGEELFVLTGDGANKVTPFLDELGKLYEYTPLTQAQLCQNLSLYAEKIPPTNYGKIEPFYLSPPQVTLKGMKVSQP